MTSSTRRALRPRFAGISAFLILMLASVDLRAEMTVLRVDPQQTDPAIEEVHGPHIALYDPQVASAHRLLVFFVGTGSKAESSLTIDSAFTKWGYHAIGLDYENSVLAVSCAHSQNSACFDHYREAIVTGAASERQDQCRSRQLHSEPAAEAAGLSRKTGSRRRMGRVC